MALNVKIAVSSNKVEPPLGSYLRLPSGLIYCLSAHQTMDISFTYKYALHFVFVNLSKDEGHLTTKQYTEKVAFLELCRSNTNHSLFRDENALLK